MAATLNILPAPAEGREGRASQSTSTQSRLYVAQIPLHNACPPWPVMWLHPTSGGWEEEATPAWKRGDPGIHEKC